MSTRWERLLNWAMLAAAAVVAVGTVTDESGWSRVWRTALAAYLVLVSVRGIHRDRRKRRDHRQAQLKRLHRLMLNEVRRR